MRKPTNFAGWTSKVDFSILYFVLKIQPFLNEFGRLLMLTGRYIAIRREQVLFRGTPSSPWTEMLGYYQPIKLYKPHTVSMAILGLQDALSSSEITSEMAN